MATETGVWCNKCFPPAAIRVDVVAVSRDGIERPLGAIEFCPDCAERDDRP